mgnify:CR=1 FL=1|tara:strand:+ start:870 stop:1835 length:966 start_codon:yes stop_codon:yes gene_type:complete
MTKILIIRFSSIGDIVLTSPIMRCVKMQKNFEIHYLTKSEYSILLSANPYVDKVFVVKHNLNYVISDLKLENYDFIIDLHNNLRSWWVKFNLLVSSRHLQKYNWKKYLLIYFNCNYNIDHVVDRYFEVVKKLNVVNDNNGLDYFFNENTSLDFNINQTFIAWSIGGSSIYKKLSKQQILEVVNQVSYPIVLLGGVDEISIGDILVQECSHKKIYNFCGKISLDQSAYLIKNSALVLTNDTGLMHIAASFQKPIISFWGCTKPSLGFSPYMTSDKSIQIIARSSSRPCSKHGSHCRFKGNECIKEIDSMMILEAIENFFNLS